MRYSHALTVKQGTTKHDVLKLRWTGSNQYRADVMQTRNVKFYQFQTPTKQLPKDSAMQTVLVYMLVHMWLALAKQRLQYTAPKS